MSNSNAKPTSDLHLMTIGVYGADEDSFFGALTNAGVDTFCDVRRHRGLRGRKLLVDDVRKLLVDRSLLIVIHIIQRCAVTVGNKYSRGAPDELRWFLLLPRSSGRRFSTLGSAHAGDDSAGESTCYADGRTKSRSPRYIPESNQPYLLPAMPKTAEAIVGENGQIQLLESLPLRARQRVLVTALEEESFPNAESNDSAETRAGETALLSESALAEDWNRKEEDEAWSHLQPDQ